MDFIHHYNSPLGDITEASDGVHLTGLWFDGQKYYPAALEKEYEEKDLPVFRQTDKWLNLYFGGEKPDFIPPVSMKGTEFQKSVWEILLTIPYGQTMTYGEIAGLIAKATARPRMSARAIGGAVGRNMISLIIPCHRVIGAHGRLTGYAGGIDRKAKLLEFEKANAALT